jgi:hypothetical protein
MDIKRTSPQQILMIILIASAVLFASCQTQQHNPTLVATEKIPQPATPGAATASVGWSTNANYTQAIADSVRTAKQKLGDKQPTFAYVVYISEQNHDQIIDEVRKNIGPGVKIIGLTSNTIITNDQVIQGKDFAIGVLLSASSNITIGIGTVDLAKTSTPELAGETAVKNAIRDAGKTEHETPNVILYMGTTRRGEENQVMDGIAKVVGKDVPVIGGNSKDASPKVLNNWRQFTQNETYTTGLIIATIYANKTGWGFESTFKMTAKRGIVTKSDGFRILEIDHRPALDVYNEWVEGEFYRKLAEGAFNSSEENVDFNRVKAFTLLNPIAKIVRNENGQMGDFATSPIPDADDIKNKSISVYAQISTGDEISLYRGTWEIAMNRVEKIPNDALMRGRMTRGEGSFAVMAFCNGLKTILPPEELEKVGAITNDIIGVPFIGAVTAGEQGPIPGIRNVNANLVESVVIVG